MRSHFSHMTATRMGMVENSINELAFELIAKCKRNCRNQAMSQLCAFSSPKTVMMSAMGMFHQLTRGLYLLEQATSTPVQGVRFLRTNVSLRVRTLAAILLPVVGVACTTSPPTPRHLRLSREVTYVCLDFTAKWCDETWRKGDVFTGVAVADALMPLSPCVDLVSVRPTVPVVWGSGEDNRCAAYKRYIRDHPIKDVPLPGEHRG